MRVKLELLTIISKTLQVFSSFFLLVVVFSFVTIKMKSRRDKKRVSNFSNQQEREIIMRDAIAIKSNDKSDVYLDGKNLSRKNNESNNFSFKKKIKIYTVYNPESHPNFYLHNKLSWYKNFD